MQKVLNRHVQETLWEHSPTQERIETKAECFCLHWSVWLATCMCAVHMWVCVYLLEIHAQPHYQLELGDMELQPLCHHRLLESATLNTFLMLSTHSVISFCHVSPSKPNRKRNFFSRASNTYQPGVRLWNTPSTKQKKSSFSVLRKTNLERGVTI